MFVDGLSIPDEATKANALLECLIRVISTGKFYLQERVAILIIQNLYYQKIEVSKHPIE